MHYYEINLLLSPKPSNEEIESLALNLEQFFSSFGKTIKENKAERKRLAYPINKETEAWFCYFTFYPENPKEALEAIEKKLKENKEIIRYLIIKKQPQKEVIRRKKEIKITPSPEQTPKAKVQLEEVEEKLHEMLGD